MLGEVRDGDGTSHLITTPCMPSVLGKKGRIGIIPSHFDSMLIHLFSFFNATR